MRQAAALLSLTLGSAALAGQVLAAPPLRTPEQLLTLMDLAKVMGEAHALHRICAGPADDTWRARMARLIEVESPSDGVKARLTDSFNSGFMANEAKAKDCHAAAMAEAEVAKRGAALARKLAPAPNP